MSVIVPARCLHCGVKTTVRFGSPIEVGEVREATCGTDPAAGATDHRRNGAGEIEVFYPVIITLDLCLFDIV